MSETRTFPNQSLDAPGATWLAHIDFDDRSVALRIDEVVLSLRAPAARSIGLADRWKNGDPVSFARRALEVSVYSADDAIEELLKASWISQWEHGASLAGEALDSIRKLNRFLANSRATQQDPTASAIAYPLRTMTSRMMPEKSLSERYAWADAAGSAFMETETSLEAIRLQMQQYRTDIASGRKNPGEAEKTAFVKVWAEAWVSLTGRFPGKGMERNPFLGLVERAWSDVLGPRDQSFVSALRNWQDQHRCDITNPQSYVPTWAWR